MNHATWSVGSYSSPPTWRPNARPPQPPRPRRPGSTSPRRERKSPLPKNPSADSNSSRSREASPMQLSPNRDNQDKNHTYHYLSVNEPVKQPLTPPSSTQRKKYHKQPDNLAVQDSAMSRSPSAPNLQATATSMLALQGSMTGFTAMAVGKHHKALESSTKHKVSTQLPKHKVSTQPPIGFDNSRRSANETPKITVQGQPQCTCRRSTMSPTPRLVLHTHIPQNNCAINPANENAWKERRQEKRPNDKQKNVVIVAPNKTSFKETSV